MTIFQQLTHLSIVRLNVYPDKDGILCTRLQPIVGVCDSIGKGDGAIPHSEGRRDL